MPNDPLILCHRMLNPAAFERSEYSARDLRWIRRAGVYKPRFLDEICWTDLEDDRGDLGLLHWIERRENVVVMADDPEAGRVLAEAITCEALRRLWTARVESHTWFKQRLQEVETAGRLRQFQTRWSAFDLVVLHGVDLAAGDDEALVERFLTLRTGRASTMLVVNRRSSRWRRAWADYVRLPEPPEYFTALDPVTRISLKSRDTRLDADTDGDDYDDWELDEWSR